MGQGQIREVRTLLAVINCGWYLVLEQNLDLIG